MTRVTHTHTRAHHTEDPTRRRHDDEPPLPRLARARAARDPRRALWCDEHERTVDDDHDLAAAGRGAAAAAAKDRAARRQPERRPWDRDLDARRQLLSIALSRS